MFLSLVSSVYDRLLFCISFLSPVRGGGGGQVAEVEEDGFNVADEKRIFDVVGTFLLVDGQVHPSSCPSLLLPSWSFLVSWFVFPPLFPFLFLATTTRPAGSGGGATTRQVHCTWPGELTGGREREREMPTARWTLLMVGLLKQEPPCPARCLLRPWALSVPARSPGACTAWRSLAPRIG